MRAWILDGSGVAALRQVERPDPVPAPGHVVVRVRATSLNHRDLGIARRGVDAPLVPLSDGAGEVVATGEGVTRWTPGDRVMANFFTTWSDGPWRPHYGESALGGAVDGMLAELVALPESALVAVPEGWSFEEAATLPCAGVTAWHALFEDRPVRPGDLVVVQGTGGVSVFALQLARLAGAQVAATSSSDRKLEVMAELGATFRVNYRTTPDWAAEVRAVAGRDADHVVEVTGQLDASLSLAGPNGTVTVIGTTLGTDGPTVAISPSRLLRNSLHLRGVYVGSTAMLRRLASAMASADVRPVIDSVHPFDDAVAAYETMAAATHLGKIVVTV